MFCRVAAGWGRPQRPLPVEGGFSSSSCSTGDTKGNPAMSLFPLEGNAAKRQRVYDAASRIDTLRCPDCQTAAFLPTGIFSVLVGVNVGAYQDSSPAAQNDHEGGKARQMALSYI